MKSIHDEVAALVLSTFERLPAKSKPRQLQDGRREWVPIAGIVAVREQQSTALSAERPTPQCLAVATGMKCLPRDKIPQAQGNVLHDWHAEILAIRGFNRWIVDECEALTLGKSSQWLQETRQRAQARKRLSDAYNGTKLVEDSSCNDTKQTDNTQLTSASRPFKLQDDTSIYMYVSAAPCGDASMELTMAAQDDSTPWTKPPPSARPGDMIGRAHFDQLGVVRRKPSRPDAPSTWSKSCSDKLALKQCTGLLSSLVSTLIEPVYIKSLILPEDQISSGAVERAWGADGRMAPLVKQTVNLRWAEHGFAFRPFTVASTKHEFGYKKLPGCPSSNVAMLWTPYRQESLVNGVLMGRKQSDPRGASSVSRRVMWQAVNRVATAAGLDIGPVASYAQAKAYCVDGRELVKTDVKNLALHGWRRNDGDEEWPG